MKINIILVLFLIVSLSIGCYQEAEPKDPNNFIGLWSLYIMEELNSETGEWSEWRDGMQGYILYDDKNSIKKFTTSKTLVG